MDALENSEDPSSVLFHLPHCSANFLEAKWKDSVTILGSAM